MKAIGYIIISSFFIGCTVTTNDNYIKSQSKLISNYRSQGFFEYSSRLNGSMWSVLDGYKNNLISNATYHKIVETSKKLETEKPKLGCYLIDWNDNPYDETSKILLE